MDLQHTYLLVVVTQREMISGRLGRSLAHMVSDISLCTNFTWWLFSLSATESKGRKPVFHHTILWAKADLLWLCLSCSSCLNKIYNLKFVLFSLSHSMIFHLTSLQSPLFGRHPACHHWFILHLMEKLVTDFLNDFLDQCLSFSFREYLE